MCRIVTPIGCGTTAFVYDQTYDLALQAVTERLLNVQHEPGQWREITQPSQKMFFSVMKDFRTRLLRCIEPVRPLSYDEFVDTYDGKRRTRYQEACDSLAITDIQPKDFVVRGFLKGEIYISTRKKPLPCPRLISPRSPRANAYMGRFLKPIEKPIYRAIAKIYGAPTVLKGYNAVDTATAITENLSRFSDPVLILFDFVRFDAHVSSPAIRWTHKVYGRIMPYKEFLQRLRHLVFNKIVIPNADGVVVVDVEGKRCSGDMDTSTGNCLLVCAMLWSYARSIGVRILAINQGDDCGALMERSDVAKFKYDFNNFFQELGFRVEIECETSTIEHIDFCKTRPVWDGVGYRMVRSFPLCIDKDLMATLPLDNLKAMKRRFFDIGNCGRALSVGIPVLKAFYHMLLRWSDGIGSLNLDSNLDTGMQFAARGLVYEDRPISSRSRYSFHLAFGVTPDEQILLEQQYNQEPCPEYSSRRCNFQHLFTGLDRGWVPPV